MCDLGISDQIQADWVINFANHGPEVIKRFSCSNQLSMKFIMLLNVKMPTKKCQQLLAF